MVVSGLFNPCQLYRVWIAALLAPLSIPALGRGAVSGKGGAPTCVTLFAALHIDLLPQRISVAISIAAQNKER
jgi:hypothetical protein